MPDEPQVNPIRPPFPSPHYAPMRPEPSWERLQAKHSLVTVKNTSELQNHVVIDRFNVGHELRPGEKREIDMLNNDIASFQENRRTGRFYPVTDPAELPKPKPPHPILIEGVGDLTAEVRAEQNAEQAELLRIKREREREQIAETEETAKQKRR